MRILVTGGCGFIGHRVVAQLQSRGHQVRIIDNLTTYGIIPRDEHNYLVTERKKLFNPGTIVHDISIEDRYINAVFEMFLPEIVIHLASMPRQRIVNADPVKGARVMCEGLLNLVEQSHKFGAQRFVYVSSSMIYGNFTDGVREDAHCQPQGSYAIMKYTGEQLVREYTRSKNLEHVVVRPSAVYGPLDIEDRVVSRFMIGAMRDDTLTVRGPDERLDFTYVDDTVSGIVGASLGTNTRNKTYNITRSESITLLEAAELAIKIAGSGQISVRERDSEFPSRGSLNIDAAQSDFDFKPRVDFKQGLTQYYEWLKNSEFWRQRLKI
jgi:nucleoside-diphosphate-sugar epimerase